MSQAWTIGWIGIGEMGLPMATNLVRAGYRVEAFDLVRERVENFVRAGGAGAASIEELVEHNDLVFTTLPSSEAFVSVAEEELIPRAKEGQIFVECGTTIPHEIIRLEGEFRRKGAHLLDVPMSGGPIGAQKGTLRMWCGGDAEIFERVLPVLEVLGNPGEIHHCGPSGYGQYMKGVNQLWMGLFNAVQLEILAYGIRSGLDISLIKKVFPQLNIAERVERGEGNYIGVKFRELPYYISDARQRGFRLPMTEALYAFCEKGERVVIDDHRPAPSFWNELTKTG